MGVVDEAVVAEAIRAFREGQFPSERQCAAHYKLALTTFRERLHGPKKSLRKAHTKQPVLTDAQENGVVSWIHQQNSVDSPPSRVQVQQYASALSMQHVGRVVGRHWYGRFCTRHPEIVEYVENTAALTNELWAPVKSSTETKQPDVPAQFVRELLLAADTCSSSDSTFDNSPR